MEAVWSQKLSVVLRITERAVRTWPLNEWALLRRIQPDGGSTDPDPWRFIPDKGSSLGFDDLGFMPKLGDRLVSSTARFPVMMATDSLVGAAQVHAAAFQQQRTNIAAVAALCRCAVEASARTIWLLADTDRAERRARCIGFTQSERQPQEGFIRVEEAALNKRGVAPDAPEYKNFLRHRAERAEAQELIASMPKADRRKPPTNALDIVTWSARWLDANPPPHTSESAVSGLELAAARFYSYSSSFVHAYKWMNNYIRDDLAALKMIADGFATALVMTESAVALFEAQSTHPARTVLRRVNYPDSLVPTVDAWASRYRD